MVRVSIRLRLGHAPLAALAHVLVNCPLQQGRLCGTAIPAQMPVLQRYPAVILCVRVAWDSATIPLGTWPESRRLTQLVMQLE